MSALSVEELNVAAMSAAIFADARSFCDGNNASIRRLYHPSSGIFSEEFLAVVAQLVENMNNRRYLLSDARGKASLVLPELRSIRLQIEQIHHPAFIKVGKGGNMKEGLLAQLDAAIKGAVAKTIPY